MIDRTITFFMEQGDIGHVALFLWAASASALVHLQLRDLARITARFEAFVLAIARLNAMLTAPHLITDEEAKRWPNESLPARKNKAR